MGAWELPAALPQRLSADPKMAGCVTRLPQTAGTLANRRRLRSDGSAWSGVNSAVWPVTAADGEPLALKVSVPHPGAVAEPLATGGTMQQQAKTQTPR